MSLGVLRGRSLGPKRPALVAAGVEVVHSGALRARGSQTLGKSFEVL